MTQDTAPTEPAALSGPDTIVLRAVVLRGPFARCRDRVQLPRLQVRFTNAGIVPLSLTGATIDPLRREASGTAVTDWCAVEMPNQPIAPGDSVAVTLNGWAPARAGVYRSVLRLGLGGGRASAIPVETRVSASSLWCFGCLLLGLMAIGLGNVMDRESGTRRDLHEALQLRQEVHEAVEQVPAPLVALLPVDNFDRELDRAAELLGQRRRWSFIDHRAADAKPHLEAAKEAAAKVRAAIGSALGAADCQDLDLRWKELKASCDSLARQFPVSLPADDTFAGRLDAFDAWLAQRLLAPSLGYFEIFYPYELVRVRLLYAAGREVEAANLANSVRRELARGADGIRETAERLAFFRQTAADNLTAERSLRRHLESAVFAAGRREPLMRALDAATAALHPPFTWGMRREMNSCIEKLTTTCFQVEQEAALAAVKAAAAREDAEDSIEPLQPVIDQGAALPRGPDGKIVPEAKFAWLERLAAAWRERLAAFPEPNPPGVSAALDDFERAVASRNIDDISARQKALLAAWQKYSTDRALALIAQAVAPFSLDLRENIFIQLEVVREGLHSLGSHPQQAAWENAWEALRMRAAATPDRSELMNRYTYDELSNLASAVYALSNEVDSARWDTFALSPSARRWLVAELGEALAKDTKDNLLADIRLLRIATLTPAREQYAGREIRFQISNLDPGWKNGVRLTLAFGDGATQSLTAEEQVQSKTFSHVYAAKARYTLSAWAEPCVPTGAASSKLGATSTESPQTLLIADSPVSTAEALADRFFNLRYGLALLIAVGLYFWRFQARTEVLGADPLDYARAFTLGFAASLAVNAPETIANLFM